MTDEFRLREIIKDYSQLDPLRKNLLFKDVMKWHKAEMRKLVPETVYLKDRTDKYLVRTYNGKTIFVGLWSDTVTNESRDSIEDDVR